jgi:hypothetical protein
MESHTKISREMRMNDLKPIETKYKGYTFRSRTEARWAVFFDAVGMQWEYEKEGYDLGNGIYYLPDFWMPEINTWIEIKPKSKKYGDDKDSGKPRLLSIKSVGKVVILYGAPGPVEFFEDTSPYYGYALFGESGDYPYVWCECPYCGVMDLQFEGRSARSKHEDNCFVNVHRANGEYFDKNYNTDSCRLESAYAAARSARFEHGQSGATR